MAGLWKIIKKVTTMVQILGSACRVFFGEQLLDLRFGFFFLELARQDASGAFSAAGTLFSSFSIFKSLPLSSSFSSLGFPYPSSRPSFVYALYLSSSSPCPSPCPVGCLSPYLSLCPPPSPAPWSSPCPASSCAPPMASLSPLSHPSIPPSLNLHVPWWQFPNSSKLPLHGHPSLTHCTISSPISLPASISLCLASILRVQMGQLRICLGQAQGVHRVWPQGCRRRGYNIRDMHSLQLRCLEQRVWMKMQPGELAMGRQRLIYYKRVGNFWQVIISMGEDYLPLESGDKKLKYENLLAQLYKRIDAGNHIESNRANLIAMLKCEFNWWWVGFYFIHKNKLVLGCFQGPPACSIIAPGAGVCGAAWKRNQTIIVPNVNEFEGHIACSSSSLSEIVVPVRRNGEVLGVLDVDSAKLADFDEVDQGYLQKILGVMEELNQFRDWKQQ